MPQTSSKSGLLPDDALPNSSLTFLDPWHSDGNYRLSRHLFYFLNLDFAIRNSRLGESNEIICSLPTNPVSILSSKLFRLCVEIFLCTNYSVMRWSRLARHSSYLSQLRHYYGSESTLLSSFIKYHSDRIIDSILPIQYSPSLCH